MSTAAATSLPEHTAAANLWEFLEMLHRGTWWPAYYTGGPQDDRHPHLSPEPLLAIALWPHDDRVRPVVGSLKYLTQNLGNPMKTNTPEVLHQRARGVRYELTWATDQFTGRAPFIRRIAVFVQPDGAWTGEVVDLRSQRPIESVRGITEDGRRIITNQKGQ